MLSPSASGRHAKPPSLVPPPVPPVAPLSAPPAEPADPALPPFGAAGDSSAPLPQAGDPMPAKATIRAETQDFRIVL
jgi:hypothetical protein